MTQRTTRSTTTTKTCSSALCSTSCQRFVLRYYPLFLSPTRALLTCNKDQLYESQMQTVLAESNARAQVVKEYEAKMLDMERQYQARLREEARRLLLTLLTQFKLTTPSPAGRRGGEQAQRQA